MSDDSVDGFIDSYGPVVVAGDLGAAQGRGSDRLGPYETAVSASITVPHDMTDTQVAMPAELFRVPVVDLCNIHQQDSLLGDPTERHARKGLGISTQGAVPALHSALAHSMQAQSDSNNDDAVLRQPAAPARISDDLMMEIARSRSYYSQNQALFALWQYTTGGASRRWPMGVPGRAPDLPMATPRGELLYLQTAFW